MQGLGSDISTIPEVNVHKSENPTQPVRFDFFVKIVYCFNIDGTNSFLTDDLGTHLILLFTN